MVIIMFAYVCFWQCKGTNFFSVNTQKDIGNRGG